MTIDDLKTYVVVLNNGSGVFFQPLDATVTYVLTAKHVIENAGNQVNIFKYFECINYEWIERDLVFRVQLEVNYFPHPAWDVAILIVPKIPGLDKLIRTDAILADRQGYMLVGYPEIRRKAGKDIDFAGSLRINEGVAILQSNIPFREAKVPGNLNIEDIRGQSGGFLGKIDGDLLLLAGIQSQMAGGEKEELGHIDFLPMSSFDTLVELYPTQLSELHPSYMGCFSFLKDLSFILDVSQFDESKIELVRNLLNDKAEKIIESDATPNEIKRIFSSRLLIDKQHSSLLSRKGIWVAWLEFLTILNVIRYEDFSEAGLGEIFNSIRLLYSEAKGDWSHEFKNLIYSDYKGLKSGGLVIVSTPALPCREDGYTVNPGYIVDLKRAPRTGIMKMDEGLKFPFDHFRFIHLHWFKKKAILDQIDDYGKIDDEEILLEKLKEVYGQYIA